jgi:uncharacterized protein
LIIGLISDTHGLLRPEALRALAGAQRIIHGGDIGNPEILAALEQIAPVAAVRGNNDHGAWARRLPAHLTLRIEGMSIHVLHDLKELKRDPAAAPVQVIVAGHSHRPAILQRDGVLYVNPGSAGPRRFSLPVAIALLWVESGAARAEIQHIL